MRRFGSGAVEDLEGCNYLRIYKVYTTHADDYKWTARAFRRFSQYYMIHAKISHLRDSAIHVVIMIRHYITDSSRSTKSWYDQGLVSPDPSTSPLISVTGTQSVVIIDPPPIQVSPPHVYNVSTAILSRLSNGNRQLSLERSLRQGRPKQLCPVKWHNPVYRIHFWPTQPYTKNYGKGGRVKIENDTRSRRKTMMNE